MLLHWAARENTGPGPQSVGSVSPSSYTLHCGTMRLGLKGWAEYGRRASLLSSFGQQFKMLSGSSGKASIGCSCFPGWAAAIPEYLALICLKALKKSLLLPLRKRVFVFVLNCSVFDKFT